MKIPKNTEEAKKIQLELKQRVKIAPLKQKLKFIAGVDAAFSGNNVIAAACLYKYPDIITVEDAYVVSIIRFPYISGYLSFREGPAIIKAIEKLKIKPGLILFDGQGIAHPAGMGIAAHVGVLLDIPAIGCAKSRLVGDYIEPGKSKGQHTKLKHQGKIIGTVLRTRDNVKPLFVSPGHLTDMKGAIDIVLKCTGKYRIPEPLRRADFLSKELKKDVVNTLLP
jgi:deoxyribonuclease V